MATYSTKTVLRNPSYKKASREFLTEVNTATNRGLDNDFANFYNEFPKIAPSIFPAIYNCSKKIPSNQILGLRKDGKTFYSEHYINVPKTGIIMNLFCPVILGGSLTHDAGEDPDDVRNKLIGFGDVNFPLVKHYSDGDNFAKRYVVDNKIAKVIRSIDGLESKLDRYCDENGFEDTYLGSLKQIIPLLTPHHKDWRKDLAFLTKGTDSYVENDSIRLSTHIIKTLDGTDVLKDVEVILPVGDKSKQIVKLTDRMEKIAFLMSHTDGIIEHFGKGGYKNYSPEKSLVEFGLKNTYEFLEHLIYEIDCGNDDLSRKELFSLVDSVRNVHSFHRIVGK